MQGEVNNKAAAEEEEECDGGLYAVGFTGRGLAGIAEEAVRIAGELGKAWRRQMETKQESKQHKILRITAACDG